MAAPGRLLVYLPTGEATSVSLEAGHWAGYWLDPADGRRQAVSVNAAAGEPVRLTPPAPGDQVLYLQQTDAVDR